MSFLNNHKSYTTLSSNFFFLIVIKKKFARNLISYYHTLSDRIKKCYAFLTT